MNTEAIDLTKKNKKVTFYSRSKKRIWMKGEESGNFLEFISMKSDCDNDTLLVRAIPTEMFVTREMTHVGVKKTLNKFHL